MEFSEDEVPVLLETAHTAEPESRRVPITLICGFLGAGKSTLLRWILTERHGYRIAVIMNEFGDTADIEAKVINVTSRNDRDDAQGQTSKEFLELANGCLCCSIKDSGIAAIEQLMRRKGAFDHILLETTGLADPGPIAAMFWQNEEFAMGLGKDIYLDGVICVVDAVFFEKQIRDDAESEGIKHGLRQIAGADIILVNKSDLVSELELGTTVSTLHHLNPSVPIYRTVRSHIELSKIMGIDAYGDRSKRFLQSLTPGTPIEDAADASDKHHHNGGHMEHMGISNIIVPIPNPLTDTQIAQLEEWIRSVLWDRLVPSDMESGPLVKLPSSAVASVNGPGCREDAPTERHPSLEILRCKGIWWNERGEQFLLQGVRTIYEITKIQDAGPPDQTGKVVLIGRGIYEEVKNNLVTLVGIPSVI